MDGFISLCKYMCVCVWRLFARLSVCLSVCLSEHTAAYTHPQPHTHDA